MSNTRRTKQHIFSNTIQTAIMRPEYSGNRQYNIHPASNAGAGHSHNLSRTQTIGKNMIEMSTYPYPQHAASDPAANLTTPIRKSWLGKFLPLRLFFLSFFLLGFSQASFAVNETVSAGSYIINMGVTPQTVGNGLKPYGLIYDLLNNYQVPIKWVINPSKTKDGIDFSHNGVDYKGSAFIIPAEYRTPAVNAAIASWEAQGVVGATTVSAIIVPVYITIDYVMNWTLDAQNGGIAEGYLEAAGIPETAYNWVLPGDLTCCNDIFVMPHADPEWVDGVDLAHGRLFSWNADIGSATSDGLGGCDGAIWAACHAVSALELMFNPGNPSEQTNFLSVKTGTATGGGPYSDPNNSLVEWGDHGEAGGPYNAFLPTHPVMQYMGVIDGALQNGSEQSYLPVIGGGWRPTTQLGVTIPVHPDVPSVSLGPAVKIAFGDAFGDPTRGKVMYEAGHNHGGSGTANIAAQRAFLNFSIWAAQGKAINVDVSGVAPTVEGGSDVLMLTANATGGTGVFTYQWVTDCPGTFSNPNGQTTIFTPSFVSEGVECSIRCIVQDDCGTRTAFDSESTTIVPAPVPPVANNDAEFTNPGVPVTLPPLANDTDLNLDIDPSSLAFWDPMTMMTIASPYTTPNGGTFTINFDGTVTYVSAPAFMGTEVIYYRICDLTDPMDGGPFCDVATITITVDETDEFGCTPLEEYRKLYTAYGVAEASNAYVSNPYFALGYPEGRARQKFAELKHNSNPAQRGVMTITLETTVLPGDVVSIYGWSKDGNPTTFSASGSDDGITFSDVQNYTVPDDDQTYTFDYAVTNPNGILFLRITNTNSNKEFRLDGISYDVKSCQTDCTLPFVDLVLNGTADAFDGTSTAGNEQRALGLPNLDGSDVNAGQFLILDLSDTIPNGSQIQLFLANDSQSPAPTVNVSGSLDNGSYSGTVNFTPTSDKDEQYGQFFYTVTQPFGARYLRFDALINRIYVDAVVYEIETCVDGVPVANDDVTYTVEGIPVTYEVQVNDFDPQGDVITTTQITSPPSNGTAVINTDGTITYLPNPDFNGTDVLTYQICDPTNLCDEATLTIIIPNDGCTDPGQQPKQVGTGYGFTVADPAAQVSAEERAIGPADGQYAEINTNGNYELRVSPSLTVFGGDFITFYASGQDGDAADFTVQIFNGVSWVGAQTYSVSGTVFQTFTYLVADAAGAQQIRFVNNDANDKLRIDAIEYPLRECLPECAQPEQITITANGYAVSATGDGNPANLVGAPDGVSQQIDLSDSPVTIVDLGQLIPQNGYIYLYLARNGTNAATLEVSSSPTNGSFTNAITFSPTSPSPNFQQHSFKVAQASGIRYLRLDVIAGDRVFIDAIEFFVTICADGTPVALDDFTATSEETPITYPVQVNDSDPQGDPLVTTQILSPPANGSAIINPDGTITYTPDPEFTGTDMLTYQICEPSGLCDDAVLTITVVDDGCASGETGVIVGTGYGFSVADPGATVSSEENAIGIPDGLFATLNNNVSSELRITPVETILPGEVITFHVSNQDADAADFTVQIFNGTSWVDAETYSVSGTVFQTFEYTVADPGGALQIRFINNDVDDDLRVDAIEYNLRECTPTGCVKPETAFVRSGYVPLAGGISGDRNFADLEGAPNQIGTEIRLADVNPTIVDFGQIIPQGAKIFLYLARNGTSPATLEVQSSLTNGSYTNAVSFSPTSPSPNFQQHSFIVAQASGLQFLRLDVIAGDRVFIDAIQYVTFETNSLAGYVWNDNPDEDGLFDTGETPYAGVEVDIYRDVDASGTVSAGDVFLATKITDANGFYSYQFFAGSLPQNYVMAVDESTLPSGDNYYTTAQYQTATLTTASDSDCDNNFGRAFDNPPVANDDTDATEQNVPIVIDVYANDQNPDVDGETTTVTSIVSPPSSGGTASVNPDGTINYVPPVGFTGTETFTYLLCDEADPGVLCDEATVTVTVNPFVNDPPVAVDDAATTEQDVPVSVNVLDNDSDPEGDLLTVTCVGTDASAATPATCNGTTQQGGTVTILPSGEIYYEPPPGYSGPDQTTYVICDPSGACDDAVIDLTVSPDLNNQPVATNDDNVIVYQPCGATTFDVLANDYDLDGNLVPSSVTITMPLSPATGTLINNLDGTFTYTAAGAGTFTFEYQVCDDGTPLPAQCDVATVTITVPVSNTAPTANDDGDAITSGDQLTTPVLSNDSDPEGDELTVTLCDPNNPLTACGLSSSTSTQGGTVTVLPSGKTQYTPPAGFAGTDTYFYRICDNGCPNLCDFATVTVTVENQPPVAVNDADVTAINTALQVDVLVNDFDPEGEDITLQSAGTDPNNPIGGGTLQGGSVSVNNNGTPGDPTDDFIDYTPPSNFIGQDTFYYEICDANLFDPQCDVARVIITITSPVDIELTKTVFPEQPDAGDNVTFTITLSNTSSATATGVVVKDQLPSGLTYVSDNSGGTYDPNTGVWFIGTVPPGSSVELQIVATVDSFTDATNVAEVTAQNEVDEDSIPNNNILGEDDQDAVILQCVLKREPISVTQNP